MVHRVQPGSDSTFANNNKAVEAPFGSDKVSDAGEKQTKKTKKSKLSHYRAPSLLEMPHLMKV